MVKFNREGKECTVLRSGHAVLSDRTLRLVEKNPRSKTFQIEMLMLVQEELSGILTKLATRAKL